MAIETPPWGKRIQDAIAHFESTGDIQDILRPRIDQRGCWIPVILNEEVEEALIEKLAGTILSPERLTSTNDTGESTLLCSFVDDSKGIVKIPYHHVKGQILVSEAGTLSAPVLLSVGERMVSICAMEFHIPKLQFVGFALEAQSAVKFNAPNLQSVGGWLCAEGAIEFHAPKLQSVGGGLGAHFAEKLHIPKLQSVEKELDAGSARNFDAPELQSVGGGLNAGSAVQFNAPKLQSVGGDLIDYDAEDFYAPNLLSVRGSMYAGSATKLNAGVLKRVGGALDTRNASDFYIRPQYVGGDRELHPDAERNWQRKQQALRDAMKKQSELEI
ncbi:MAG: hypothetical protein WCP35_20525 [Verrucomicrobiota bacterium]